MKRGAGTGEEIENFIMLLIISCKFENSELILMVLLFQMAFRFRVKLL
jgi:hypothetical protein